MCVCACVLMLSVGRGACSLNGAERNCGQTMHTSIIFAVHVRHKPLEALYSSVEIGPGPATWRRDKNKRSRQDWSLQAVKNCLHGMAQHLRHGWLLASYCEDAHHLSIKTSIHSLQTCNAPVALRHVTQTGSCRLAGTQDARYKRLRGHVWPCRP